MSGDSAGSNLPDVSLVSAENVLNALVVHGRVLYALVLRETKTRYGEHKNGVCLGFY